MHSLAEPMFLLLFGAAGIYMLLGDRTEAFVLLVSVLVIITITIYQERKTERVLEALRDLSSPRALVVRDGERRRIPGREVVIDDLLVVAEGDRIAADGRLLTAVDLRVDESLLTGESVPVDKRAVPQQGSATTDHRVFAGCLVVKGHGLAQVTATGARTEMGAIGQSLAALGLESTALQAETRRLVRVFSIIAFALCVLLAGFDFLARGNALEALLAGLTLAMAILPEEFPVVLAVFLALGAWRLSRVNVLTRRVGAIEALGAATVLCVDKTGTLTQNRMKVRRLWDGRGTTVDLAELGPAPLPDELADAVRISVMASEPNPFDPMERAFHELHELDADIAGEIVHRYPMAEDLLVVTHVWRRQGHPWVTIAAKGAPESIVALCGLPPADAARVLREASAMASAGLRVLGLAARERADGPLPTDPRGLEPRFVGLVGLADPLRPTVHAAMRECLDAGVRVVMITGDYPETALAIARDAGLAEVPRVLTGRELDALSDDELRARLPAVDVFARVVPAQKLRIVTALKARDEIVAMTGDGVNDGPALKAAHIGIAMGGRGTDVAREAAAWSCSTTTSGRSQRPSARAAASSTTSARRCRIWCRCTSPSPASDSCR